MKTIANQPQVKATMETSQYGHPLPAIRVVARSWRDADALLYGIAAEISKVSTEQDPWIVNVNRDGWVYLEGCDDPGDPQKGFELMKRVALQFSTQVLPRRRVSR